VSTQVVRLSTADWRLLAALRLRALSDTLGESSPQYREEAGFSPAQWRRRMRAHAAFAVLVGDRAVGLIAAQPQGSDSVYLYSLWLHPAVRGRGLARRLVAVALNWARVKGARTVRLRVAVDNAAARTVYESLGFSPSGDADRADEVAMTLSVS
jgi:RimJ/RimL family protein N-acetyltransferase